MKWPTKKTPSRLPVTDVVAPGWVPTKEEKDIEARMAAVRRRITQDALPTTPAVVLGERIFTPSTQDETVDVGYDTSSYAVNYIVRSGQTYDIEVPYNAPGIFVARAITVTVQARRPEAPGVSWYRMSYAGAQRRGAASVGNSTLKISDTVTTTFPNRAVSFFWNLQDPRSGRQYADDLVPDLHLLPGTPSIQVSDGGTLAFHAPWVMERDSQLTFKFRPITDIVQRAVSAGGQPYTTDQENSKRDNSVRVKVELLGNRYFTDQDMLRKGATIP